MPKIMENTPAKILIDKYTGMKADMKCLAKKGEVIYLYDLSREDVFLAKNKSGVTFSVRADQVKLIENGK